MRLLASCTVEHRLGDRQIKLYQGDLAAIPPAEAVDCLVVSAFPNDYAPTETSLIGALDRAGVSVEQLAADKEVDLRGAFSCWLSKELPAHQALAGFRRVLCFEPLTRGEPGELTGDIFRALMPFALGETPITSIAMPIVASGDQQFDEIAMFRSLLGATLQWLLHGLPIDTVKIVIRSDDAARILPPIFEQMVAETLPRVASVSPSVAQRDPQYDCFISYARVDSAAVDQFVAELTRAQPNLRIFQDKLELKAGSSWQEELDDALAHCKRFIALYSPAYLQSRMCKDEFDLARLRHQESEERVLLPVYLHSADLPLYMRAIQYEDCREGDVERIRQVCNGALRSALSS